MDKQRLDIFIATTHQISRNQATALIKDGKVQVNGKLCLKASLLVGELDDVVVLSNNDFVSRAGEKLHYALSKGFVLVDDKNCLDVGASTGGFTQCLLQYKAKHVVALDVGTNQLHESLKNNPKVTSLEQSNIKDVRATDFDQLFDIITVDVSFISLDKILEYVIALLAEKGYLILLIKPQFEVGQAYLNKKGIVVSNEAIAQCLNKYESYLMQKQFHIHAQFLSQPTGKLGNKEYFLIAQKRKESYASSVNS